MKTADVILLMSPSCNIAMSPPNTFEGSVVLDTKVLVVDSGQLWGGASMDQINLSDTSHMCLFGLSCGEFALWVLIVGQL